jgi:U11/U12 small nuclear ribonucleoprotein 31 kDa protein
MIHIIRKEYPDKSRCYECGSSGHLSYKCPKNVLGEREPPPKKARKKRERHQRNEFGDVNDEESGNDEV